LVKNESEGFQPDEGAMRLAIAEARKGIRKGQTPFGACIANDGEILAVAHNCVFASTDITCHAEIAAIREACSVTGDVHLTGAVCYTTCEPCPMCFSACHWADIAALVYGAEIQDAAGLGFRELTISDRTMKEVGNSRIEIVGGFLRDECITLFTEWSKRPDRRTY
jgi:tRNA(Arg) A34 adenosine deaminase TadA